MPEKLLIKVCVMALTYGQHNQIQSTTLQQLIGDCMPVYDLNQNGKVYSSSPDEWSPFEDNKKIVDFLDQTGFGANSLSHYIYDYPQQTGRDAILKDTELYIIDPLFLALEATNAQMIAQLDAVISTSQKDFCLILPEQLTTALKEQLSSIAEDKMPMSKDVYIQQYHGMWLVNSSTHLIAYLNGVRLKLKNKPNDDRLRMFADLWGGGPTGLNNLPRLMGP
jgi:hypothetical protein